MSEKFALIIANTEYADPPLMQITSSSKDVQEFARVLKDQEIGAFGEVNILLNQSVQIIREAIDSFFYQKKPDDLLVFYFFGHAIRDEMGEFYLAVKDTNRSRLRSTAIKSDFVREVMDQSRSKRQVLILDCCNSGIFVQGTKTVIGVSIGTASAFKGGYGRIILTASDSTQFVWDGDKVIGETDNSLFTHFLVEGLEGEADQDGDGRITVDELYDYAYEKIRFATPKQTPSKFSSNQQGEIVLRQSTRIESIKALPLSAQLIDEIEDTRPYVREAAVQKLEKILRGKNIGLARSAKEALEKIAAEDDSRRVSQVAIQMLESISQIEQKAEEERKAREEAERLAIPKAEEERLAREMAQVERKAARKVELDAVELASRRKAEREAAEKAEHEAIELAARRKEEREAKAKVEKSESKRGKDLKISVTNPKLLSKRFASSFLLQIYLPEERSQVTRNIKSEFADQKASEYMQLSTIRIGQRLQVKFFSPVIDFPDPVIKLIDRPINKITLLGMPKDNCEPGSHKISVSISDADKGQELESFTIMVQVADFAFDHVSRPLLSRVFAVVLSVGSFAMFILTFLEQIDKTVGLTSGTAAGVFALGIYASFYNLYQRVRPNTP